MSHNSECIRLSGDIVRMLSKYPTPYNIDYPIYNTLKLTEDEHDKILSLPGWHVAEVNSFAKKTDSIYTHTFIPSECILESCGSVFLSDLLKKSLLKIRTYGRSRLDKHHNFHLLTIVPMLVMPPVSIEDMDFMFKELVGDNDYKRIGKILVSTTSRLRFVQFVFADVLARHFINEINYLLDKDISVEREYSVYRSNCRVKHASSPDKHRAYRQFNALNNKIEVLFLWVFLAWAETKGMYFNQLIPPCNLTYTPNIHHYAICSHRQLLMM